MEYEYLGDGVYARHDGYYTWLTLNPKNIGVNPREIALESDVITRLIQFHDKKMKETENVSNKR